MVRGRKPSKIHRSARELCVSDISLMSLWTKLTRCCLEPERLFKDASGPPLKSIGSATSRPLADKTPFPNRQNSITLVTPHPGGGKIAKLPLIALDEAQQHTPLLPPSSTRKKQRVPRSASKSFETPVTRGDHWNVSDLSIEVGGSSLEEVHEDGPDYSEPEYMPPTAISKRITL